MPQYFRFYFLLRNVIIKWTNTYASSWLWLLCHFHLWCICHFFFQSYLLKNPSLSSLKGHSCSKSSNNQLFHSQISHAKSSIFFLSHKATRLILAWSMLNISMVSLDNISRGILEYYINSDEYLSDCNLDKICILEYKFETN